MGTPNHNDIIVGGPGSGTLEGGSGEDTFVPLGWQLLHHRRDGDQHPRPFPSALVLHVNLGRRPRSCWERGWELVVAPGTIQKVIASPSGSTLQAGPGNITLVGGQGNDWLAAGTGNQTLIAGSGNDTLVGGIGTDNLEGGTHRSPSSPARVRISSPAR